MSIRATGAAVNQLPHRRLTAIRALARLLPERCTLCDGAAEWTGICRSCHQALPRIASTTQAHHQGSRSVSTYGAPWVLSEVLAPFRYAFPVRDLLHRLKYGGQRQLGRVFGLLLAEHLAGRGITYDLLVPMPLHRTRLIGRGYNQSFEIARTLRQETGLPVLLAGMSRIRATLPQAGLSGGARRANVRGAFRIARAMGGAEVLVVDDVITTGATANELARALLRAGAASVGLAAVARS